MDDKLKTEIYEKLVDTFTDVESDLNKKINDILEKYNLDGEQINELRKYKPEVKYELDSYIFGLDQILDEKKL